MTTSSGVEEADRAGLGYALAVRTMARGKCTLYSPTTATSGAKRPAMSAEIFAASRQASMPPKYSSSTMLDGATVSDRSYYRRGSTTAYKFAQQLYTQSTYILLRPHLDLYPNHNTLFNNHVMGPGIP